MRRLLIALGILAFASLARSQEGGEAERMRTLADIRQEIEVLKVELTRLRRELATTGPARVRVSGDVMQRVADIESALAALTARVETLEHRIDRIVEDGTRRIADLEFRLTELAGGDLSRLPPPSPLGGEADGRAGAAPPPATTAGVGEVAEGPELAAGEAADVRRAGRLLEEGRPEEALALLDGYAETYPGGPLVPEAHLLRGRALEALDRRAEAARSYLDAFTAAPKGPRAPAALLALGRALAELGQKDEACITLDELAARFPEAPEAGEGAAERTRIGCN